MDADMGENAIVLEWTIQVQIERLRTKMGAHTEGNETVLGLRYRMPEMPMSAGTAPRSF